MQEPKNFSEAPGSYHWELFVCVCMCVCVCVCVCVCGNKIFLTTFHLSLLKLFRHTEMVPKRCSPRGRCSAGVLQIFRGASLIGCDSIKLQGSFFEIILLHSYSPIGLLHICRASFLENSSGGLLLNTDNFIYDF